MSILGGIKTIFGKKETPPEVTLETFANLPLYQMLQEETPFNDWRSPDAEIPSGLEETFKIYVWMYQMYMFYILTAKRFGYEIAEKVLKLQAERLNKVPGELGKQLEVAIRQIHNNVTKQVNEPHIVEVKGEKIEMPIEYGIALEFLVVGKDAPFYIDPEKYSGGNVPEMNGADFALAECLEHGKHSAQSYFQPIAQIAKVVL
jgi:hypothetical protein